MASCAHVIGATTLKLPSGSTAIYKDECTLCFGSPSSSGGLDVCLSCFNGACSESHSELHFKKTGHALALNLVRRREPKETTDGVVRLLPYLLTLEADMHVEPLDRPFPRPK